METTVEPTLPDLLPATLPYLAIIGSYLGRARFGPALSSLSSIKIIGVVDSDLRSGRAWARELPGKPTAHATVEKLLEAQPHIDGVIVASALPERLNTVEKIISAGINVLTEFPFTTTLAEMDRLIGIAESTHSRIVPALTYRLEPAALEVARAVEKGTVGNVTRVRCEVNFPLGALYALDNGVVPTSIDWYDLLQVVACRTVDLSISWLGKPESINADIDLPHHAALVGRRAADPVANLIITHERGQSTHLLRLSRSVQPTERYLLSGELGSIEHVRCEGEKLATGPFVRMQLTGSKPETMYTTEDYQAESNLASFEMISKFATSTNGDPKSSETLINARTALETVHAAFASARDGIRTQLPLLEPVNVDRILASGVERG